MTFDMKVLINMFALCAHEEAAITTIYGGGSKLTF